MNKETVSQITLLTILTVVIVGVLVVSYASTLAYAETLVIYNLEDNPIMIVDNGINNIIIFENEKYFDIRVTHYSSGGFSMKSLPGIMVFGHLIDDQYKLTVFTQEEVYRIIGDMGVLSDFQKSKNLVGADISKWDIPTEGRSDHKYVKPIEEHNPDTLDLLTSVPKRVQWLHSLNFDFIAIDSKIISERDQRLSDIPINVTILNPLMEIVGTWNGVTDNFGVFGDSYYILGNQMVGEYTVKASISKENYTSVQKMVSFFVMPLTDNSSPRCPPNYSLNATGFCVENVPEVKE